LVVSVEDNPNCTGCGIMRFEPLSLARRVTSVVYHAEDGIRCRVTGFGPDGPEPAVAQKVADSGAGTSWLVRGGPWGLRLTPETEDGDWDLEAGSQWGEPFLLVADTEDMTFG
jgi:hypothetical protein